MDPRPYFHLSFRPNIKLVSTVRRFTDEFYRRVLVDHELSARLALTTHEMLENAVAYAVDGETAIRIEVQDNILTIRTWNRATPERLQSVQAMIAEMNAVADPDEYYQTQLVKTAKRTDGSGLGIARIRAEAGMEISCEIDKDRLCVIASTTASGGVPQ
jgi:hypothetical protein